MALKTRKPTGRTGYPKILVEGGDKAGKSWSLAKLSASPKVGRTVVVVLGEDITRWDEYGKIPGARFELVEHDGTWPSLIGQVTDAKEEAARARDAGELPMVLGIDTMTAVWEGLKDWASLRARSSKKNKALLAQDPDAEIDVTSNYWNDARGRHRQLMRHLLTFPGIVVLIARGSEVTLFENGQPVANRKTWSVEGEKNLPYDVSCHVRLSRESRPLLVSASGVQCQIRPGIDRPKPMPDDWSLEGVIFDTLKLDAATAEVREFTEFRQEMTPEQVRDEALDPKTGFGRIQELYRYTDRSFPGVTLISETGDEELLLKILKRAGDDRLIADGKKQPALTAVQADAGWMAATLRIIPEIGPDACRKLWRETSEKKRKGELAEADSSQVLDLLKTRMEVLAKLENPAGPACEVAEAEAVGLDPEDPWALAVEALADSGEAETLLADVADQRSRGELDPDRAALVEQAIEARFPDLAGASQAVAA